MKTRKRSFGKAALLAVAALLGIAVVILIGFALISGYTTGKGLETQSKIDYSLNAIPNAFKAIMYGRRIAASNSGDFRDIFFLHHSTGNLLVSHGELKQAFAEKGYQFWDHMYNRNGARDPDGVPLRYHYSIPGDNTDPDGLVRIFKQPALPLPLNALSNMLQHEVIIVKSCFDPANHIASDEQLQLYKTWYLGIRETMAAHPDRIFIIMTTPPLNPAETNADEAVRARKYADWLASDEFTAGAPNVFVFDFYTLLAENDPTKPDVNMLRADYRDGSDSHPNATASRAAAPVFTQFVIEKIEQYRAFRATGEWAVLPANPMATASLAPSPTTPALPSATVAPSPAPSASPSPSPLPTDSVPAPQSPVTRVFTDGYEGDVFTAKDTQMSANWPTRNGGAHNNFQFEVQQRSLLQFDLSALPKEAKVLRATLYLYHSYEPEHGPPATITIYSIARANAGWVAGNKNIKFAGAGESCWDAFAADGSEGALTPWAGSPGLNTAGVDYEPDPLAVFVFDPGSPQGTEIPVELNPERVQGWLGETNTNYGMIMVTDVNSGHVAQSDHFIPEYRPKLVVEYEG